MAATDIDEGEYQHPLMRQYWARLDNSFPQVAEVFEDAMAEALAVISRPDLDDFLDAASFLGRMGRGVEPILAFLEEWPSVARTIRRAGNHSPVRRLTPSLWIVTRRSTRAEAGVKFRLRPVHICHAEHGASSGVPDRRHVRTS